VQRGLTWLGAAGWVWLAASGCMLLSRRGRVRGEQWDVEAVPFGRLGGPADVGNHGTEATTEVGTAELRSAGIHKCLNGRPGGGGREIRDSTECVGNHCTGSLPAAQRADLVCRKSCAGDLPAQSF